MNGADPNGVFELANMYMNIYRRLDKGLALPLVTANNGIAPLSKAPVSQCHCHLSLSKSLSFRVSKKNPDSSNANSYNKANVSCLPTHIIHVSLLSFVSAPHPRQPQPGSAYPPSIHRQTPTMPQIPSLNNDHHIHTTSTTPALEHHLISNSQKNHNRPSSSYRDFDIRHFLPRSLLNYYYARAAGLIPAKDWPRDSEDLIAIDIAIMRCRVRKISTLRRTVEWDRGFWGRDGRISRGETRGGSGGFVRERKANSAPPILAARPLLKLNPPKAPGSSAPRLRLRLNPPKKALRSEMRAEAGVKKRRKGTVRSRPAGR